MKKKLASILAILLSTAMIMCGCNNPAPPEDELPETLNTTKFQTATAPTTSEQTPETENTHTEVPMEQQTSIEIPEITDVLETTVPVLETTDSTTTTIIIDNNPVEEQTEPSGFMGGIVEETTVTTQETEVETTPAPVNDAIYTPASDCTGIEITTSYPYYSLSEKDKALYNGIISAMKQCAQVTFNPDDYSEEDWIRIFSCVYYNEPDYFWVDSVLDYGVITYKYTDPTIISNMQAEISSAISSLKTAVDQYPKTVDKIKYIHDYIITSCDFSKDGANSQTIYGGLVDHVVQCEGYSKTFLYICNKLGIQSMLVSGVVENGASHAWNKVYVDGDWYNIDITQDDPILKTPNSKYVRYTNFLVPDSDILNKTHFEQNLSMTYHRLHLFEEPTCYGNKYNYFNYYTSVINDYDTAMNELKKGISLAVSEKRPLVQIKVSSDEIYDKIMGNLLELKDYLDGVAPNSYSQISSTCNEYMNIIGISILY